MKALFLINVRSGTRRSDETVAAIEAYCAGTESISRWEMCRTREELDETFVAAAADGFEAVVAVGGDGTVSEMGRRLVGKGLALGIIPTGSGNGLARHLRIPLNFSGALDVIREGHRASIDTATVNGIRFLSIAGVGFDALIADRFEKSGMRGFVSYAKESGLAIAGYERETYRVSVDDEEFREQEAFLLAVANSTQYGNDARIAPLASLTDGLLDLCIVPKPPWGELPSTLARLFRGELHHSSALTIRKGKKVVVERLAPGPAHVDGEPLELGERLEFRVEPLALEVIVPSDVSGDGRL